MKFLCLSVFAAVSLPLMAVQNVLLLCVDDLRPDLGCYGVAHAATPHIDALAAEGRIFTRHYVQAPTCGASRYALLTGLYGPRGNEALMERAKAPGPKRPSLPEHFRQAGFTTVAVGKVSHHPGGLGGKSWADPTALEMPFAWDRQPLPCGPWNHPQGLMHGLANGAKRGTGSYPALEAVDGPDEIYPDGLITQTALGELESLAAAKRPFLLAVGWIRPHLPFGAPKKWLDLHQKTKFPPIPHAQRPPGKTTWHASGEFSRYAHGGRDVWADPEYADLVRRHYAACVSYADAQVGEVMGKLKALGLDRTTLVVLWGDHGWHLGEHGIWGKHSLFEESLRAPLIVRQPEMAEPGSASAAVVETIDIFPTLCDLCDVRAPKFLQGRSLKPHLERPDLKGGEALSYQAGAETLRTERYRLIRHREGAKKAPFFELYDHQSPEAETVNLAETRAELVRDLSEILDRKFANKAP
jgi:iduronate 2-sulfatase